MMTTLSFHPIIITILILISLSLLSTNLQQSPSFLFIQFPATLAFNIDLTKKKTYNNRAISYITKARSPTPSSLWPKSIPQTNNGKRSSRYHYCYGSSSSILLHSSKKDNDDKIHSHNELAWETSISRNPDGLGALIELISEINKKSNDNDDDNSNNNNNNNNKRMTFLFVGQYHSSNFEEIVQMASKLLDANHDDDDNDKTETNSSSSSSYLLSIIGGGVCGNGNEIDDPTLPCMSIMSGKLPSGTNVYMKSFTDNSSNNDEVMAEESTTSTWNSNNEEKAEIFKQSMYSHAKEFSSLPSFIVFADPWSPIEEVIKGFDTISARTSTDSDDDDDEEEEDSNNIDEKQRLLLPPPILVGGISCPPLSYGIKSVAMNDKILSCGSVVSLCLLGPNIGMQSIVAQGCRPIGNNNRIHTITKVTNTNVILELDNKPALQVLQDNINDLSFANGKAVTSITTNDILCGIVPLQETAAKSKPATIQDGDYLIRQIIDVSRDHGAVVVADRVRVGDYVRFHVRDGKTAAADMTLMINRAKTERLFRLSTITSSSNSNSNSNNDNNNIAPAGKPIAAIQISCVARGRSLYGKSNIDLLEISKLFDISSNSDNTNRGDDDDDDNVTPPIAGFFANGEIGPVGMSSSFLPPTTTTTSSIGDTPSSPYYGNTHMHGFTTVVALLCDYSNGSSNDNQRMFKSESSATTAEETDYQSVFDATEGSWE